jgi:energy-coupling factor transporter ATP-binding protein EcfA2
MQSYPVRRALARTAGGTRELREAVRACKGVLTAEATDVEALVRHLTSATSPSPPEALVRSFLGVLHSELLKRGEVVMWDAPSTAPRHTPREPSADISGRAEDLQRVNSHVAATSDVVICGPPGIGKTTLLEALHRLHPDAVFARLEQGGAPMRDLRLALHRRGGGEFPLDDDQGIALVAKAYSHGGLMFVDNADGVESEAAIRRLADHVPNLTFVVTSRGQPFPGFERVELEPLPAPAAAEVLDEFNIDSARQAEIIERSHGNPLILRQEAFAALHGHERESTDRLGAVLESFPDEERDALLLIGEMPAATIRLGLLVEVGHLTPANLETLRRNAVAKPIGDAYEFHQTLRSACRELLETVPRDRLAALRVAASDYYVSWLEEAPSLESIDRELPTVLHLLDAVPDAARIVALALALIGDRRDDPVGYIPSRGLAGLFREKRPLLQRSAQEVGGLPAARLEKKHCLD